MSGPNTPEPGSYGLTRARTGQEQKHLDSLRTRGFVKTTYNRRGASKSRAPDEAAADWSETGRMASLLAQAYDVRYREEQLYDEMFGPPRPHRRDANLDWYEDPELEAILIRESAIQVAEANRDEWDDAHRLKNGRVAKGTLKAERALLAAKNDPFEVSQSLTARCWQHHMDESGFDHELADARFMTAIIRYQRSA